MAVLGQRSPLSKGAPKTIRAKERQVQALELRKKGLTYVEIGTELGISSTGASSCVRTGLRKLDKLIEAEAESIRSLEQERLNMMIKALWPQIEAGDCTAISTALRVMERRARLLGLDMPERVDIGIPIMIQEIVIEAPEPFDQARIIDG